MIACALVVLNVTFGIKAIVSGGNNPETVLEKYLTENIDCDYKKAIKYTAYDFDNLIMEVREAAGLSKKEFWQNTLCGV